MSLSGEGLSFRLAEDETTIILSADGVAQGAGKILGPASIPMGQVRTLPDVHWQQHLP